jgi:hypothetical protein
MNLYCFSGVLVFITLVIMSLFYALFDTFLFDMQKTARSGLHILLGGICALTVVVFFRFVSSLDFEIVLQVFH